MKIEELEVEAVRRREVNEPVGSEIENDSRWPELKRKLDRVQELLSIENEAETDEDWQRGVWAAIHAQRTEEPDASAEPTPIARESGRSRRRFAILSMAAVAAALLVVVWSPDGPSRPEVNMQAPVLDWSIEAGERRVRGDDAKRGDRLRLRTRVPEGTEFVELRVYWEGTLVAACRSSATESSCGRVGQTLTLSWRLDAPGEYEPVLISFTGELPRLPGKLEDDAAAAKAAGAQVVLQRSIRVR